jgi:hypothetical protein
MDFLYEHTQLIAVAIMLSCAILVWALMRDSARRK